MSSTTDEILYWASINNGYEKNKKWEPVTDIVKNRNFFLRFITEKFGFDELRRKEIEKIFNEVFFCD